MDHRRGVAHVLRRAGVGAEFALAREPGDDDRGGDAEHDFAGDNGDEVANAGAFAVIFQYDLVDKIPDHAGKEHHEGVDHALDQRERDHVAVGDVRHLMGEHRLDFLARHRLQQAAGYGDQRGIFERAGGEGIRFTLVNGHFGHVDAGPIGQLVHGGHQPGGIGVFRAVENLRAGGPFGQGLGHQQRNERAAKTHHQREGEQHAKVQALRRHEAIHAEQAQGHRQHQHDCQVGHQKQDDAFHKVFLLVSKCHGRRGYRTRFMSRQVRDSTLKALPRKRHLGAIAKRHVHGGVQGNFKTSRRRWPQRGKKIGPMNASCHPPSFFAPALLQYASMFVVWRPRR